MLSFENLIFITNLWKNARNLSLLKIHIGIWDYWRNNYVTIFYTDSAWKYELQSFLNNYFTHEKKTANHFFWSTFLLLNMVIISSTISIFFRFVTKIKFAKKRKLNIFFVKEIFWNTLQIIGIPMFLILLDYMLHSM